MKLGQEHIDRLTLHLEETKITDAAVADALRLLDDLEHGSGQLPEDWSPYCHKVRHGAERKNIELSAWKDEFLALGT